jgi:hypothetical protein
LIVRVLRVKVAFDLPSFIDMPEIPLNEWAKRHKVPVRTAQLWAKTRKITARKKKVAIQMVKTWTCWVLDANTKPPAVNEK